jgi:hypothetical protein
MLPAEKGGCGHSLYRLPSCPFSSAQCNQLGGKCPSSAMGLSVLFLSRKAGWHAFSQQEPGSPTLGGKTRRERPLTGHPGTIQNSRKCRAFQPQDAQFLYRFVTQEGGWLVWVRWLARGKGAWDVTLEWSTDPDEPEPSKTFSSSRRLARDLIRSGLARLRLKSSGPVLCGLPALAHVRQSQKLVCHTLFCPRGGAVGIHPQPGPSHNRGLRPLIL